jgi:hypothetical protein
MPRGSRQPPATLTPGWAPGRSAVERGRSLRPSTTRPGPRPTLPRPPPHDLRRVAPPGRLGPSTEPLGTPQTTGNSIRPRRDGCPPHRCDPQGHRRASADETEVTGQTGGHQPAGRRTGGHQPAGQPDPGRPNQMTGHRPAGHRTAGQPDPGHRNEWVDTQWWTPTGDGQHGRPWHSRPLQHRPTAGAPSASSAVQMPPGRSATRTAQQKGHCQGASHRRDQTAAG